MRQASRPKSVGGCPQFCPHSLPRWYAFTVICSGVKERRRVRLAEEHICDVFRDLAARDRRCILEANSDAMNPEAQCRAVRPCLEPLREGTGVIQVLVT